MKQDPINKNIIPEYVTHVTQTLEKVGFEAFLVGGCVRDMLIGREVKDWDLTTNAKPEEIIELFQKTVYENNFGTVAVCIPKVTHETNISTNNEEGSVSYVTNTGVSSAETEVFADKPEILEDVTHVTKYNIVEVTPYRKEGKYSDNRHPDDVIFSENIKDDLKRRDFTMNAVAYSISKGSAETEVFADKQYKGQFVDLFEGIKDIKDKIIKAVGNPDERFQEDALRMMRAIRFSTVLNFAIESETLSAIYTNRELIKNISQERIRDEFVKIIESNNPSMGIVLLEKTGLLEYIIPELREGIECEQGGAHKFAVFEHLLGALDHAAQKGFSTEIRLAALFHDIGKPRTRRPGTKKAYTFYGHEVVGAKMVKKIMERMKFPKDTTDFVTNMVRRHMFFSDTEQITLSAVRRVIANVGVDHIWELMEIRECDRVGMNKVEAPYRLRKYHAMIEECLRDPISVSQLAIDGSYMINELKMTPGPRMGWILLSLLEEVLDDPMKNTIEVLKERILDLNELDDDTLRTLGEKAKKQKEELDEKEVGELHKKHRV